MNNLFRLASLGMFAVVLGLDTSPAAAQQLVAGERTLLSERIVGRTLREYTYRLAATNTGGPVSNVTASVSSASPNTTIVDGELAFGNIGAGETASSIDTFVLRHDRAFPFDPDSLEYTFQFDPVVQNSPPELSIETPATGSAFSEGDTVALTALASDVEDGDLASSVAWSSDLDGDLGIGANVAVVLNVGTHVITASVRDSLDATTTETIEVQVAPVPNTAPVASAGPDQSVIAGDTVTLDGSESSDADGDSLAFFWAIVSQPAGSAATLDDPTAVMPQLTTDVIGEYIIELIVNDGEDSSAPDAVTIVAEQGNAVPVANAGLDRTAVVGEIVVLDGSASNDADGDPLVFAWLPVTAPSGSVATLDDANAVRPAFSPDLVGEYVFELTVSDGADTSSADTVVVEVGPGNTPPLANAGPDLSAFEGDLIELNGSASSDIDGDALSFAWSFTSTPADSTAVLEAANTVTPAFEADVEGLFVVQLIVNDGTDDSEPDTVNITTDRRNLAPVANAGPDQSVLVGDEVTLDGSASSDADEDLLTFEWSLVSAPPSSAAQLDDPGAVSPRFFADVPGQFIVQLIVNDGFVSSASASIIVNVEVGNTAPVANAGEAQSVTTGDAVTLDASASSDADNDPLVFAWSFTVRPQGSEAALEGADSVNPIFVADVAGTYVIQLIVNDGIEDSLAATVSIAASDPLSPIELGGAIVGKNLQEAFGGTLGAPAPAGGTTVTVTSASPAQLLLSGTADGLGSAELSLTVAEGDSVIPTFYLQALQGNGEAIIAADAPGYEQTSAAVSLVPSGFVIDAPSSISTGSFSDNVPVRARSARLDPDTLAFDTVQSVRGGFGATVELVVVDVEGENVGAVDGSPLTFTGGGADAQSAAFDPINPGTATVNVLTPSGFDSPSSFDRIDVTVTAPGINAPRSLTVGRNLQAIAGLSLAQTPPGITSASVTSANPDVALVSTGSTVAGSEELGIAGIAGSFIGNVWVQAVSLGETEISVEVEGYVTARFTVTVVPSGFAIESPTAITTGAASGNTTLRVRSGRLVPGSLVFSTAQPLRPGVSTEVEVTSSNTDVGTITVSPLGFTAGQSLMTTQFDPAAAGTTVIEVRPPVNFDTPSTRRQLTATVNP